ncbi:MAG: hypothetical protein R3C49_22310 [Planctomycetaceae bacterium]
MIRPLIRVSACGLILCLCSGAAVNAQSADPASAAAPQVLQFLQPTDGSGLLQNQLLGIPSSYCGHVIDLLMHNRLRQQAGQTGDADVQLPYLTAGLKPGDLELLCVHLVRDGDACQGPVFQIGMKNNSTVPIGNFKVSVVGVLGQIQMHSPSQTVTIDRMEACQELQIQMQLPLTCMTMGVVGQQCPFDTVVVAVDSCDYLLECNELNNVQILRRGEIAPIVVQTVTTESTAVAPAAPQSPSIADAVPAPSAPVPAAPSAPSAPEPDDAPLQDIDVDQLQLGDVQNLFLRNR